MHIVRSTRLFENLSFHFLFSFFFAAAPVARIILTFGEKNATHSAQNSNRLVGMCGGWFRCAEIIHVAPKEHRGGPAWQAHQRPPPSVISTSKEFLFFVRTSLLWGVVSRTLLAGSSRSESWWCPSRPKLALTILVYCTYLRLESFAGSGFVSLRYSIHLPLNQLHK